MYPAKRFFYVSLGILALAVAVHLGARSASGLGTGLLTVGCIDGDPVAVDPAGRIWMMNVDSQAHTGPINPPKAGTILAIDGGTVEGSGEIDFIRVIYDDGDVYRNDRGSWTYEGNVFGGGVATTPTTWGRIKAERR